MSIPGSLVSTVLPSSLPALQATAKSLAGRAARAFGELLQPNPTPGSGPSEPTATPESTPAPSPENSLEPEGSSALPSRLGAWLRSVAHRLGWKNSDVADVSVVADGVSVPQVRGPDGLRQTLQSALESDDALVQEINAATRDQEAQNPLRWMPGQESKITWLPSIRS